MPLNESDHTILGLADFHEVDEDLEPTKELPIPPDYERLWSHERPTIPIPYQAIPLDTLEMALLKIAYKRG